LTKTSPSTTRALAALVFVLVALGCGDTARAADRDALLQLFVAEPYLELHEGPGRSYAVTQVVPRGESVDVRYRRTEWFRVRTRRGVEGWASEAAMRRMLLADGSPFEFDLGNRAGFTDHAWELGIAAGDYGGATLIGTRLSYAFNEQLAAELTGTQFLGTATNGYAAELGLAHVYRPDWRVSPLLTLGTGAIWIKPRTTTVNATDRRDQTAYAGAGMRLYISRRFFLRGEFRHHLVFTSRDSNEEINEWKLELAFFF
jgi:hypothetical protein